MQDGWRGLRAPAYDALRPALDEVPGWLEELDARLFAFTLDSQQRQGQRGDVLEVGVYMGRSAIVLGALTSASDAFHVCDLFDGPPSTEAMEQDRKMYYSDFNRRMFEENYQRFHPTLPVVHAGPSSDLAEKDELEGRFRFLHIDGSHRYDLVREDVALTRFLVGPGAVVVFDDICSYHSPGVAAAVWPAVVDSGLRPICMTRGKLYATWDPTGCAISADSIMAALPSEGMWTDTDVVGGTRFLLLDGRPAETAPSTTRRPRVLRWIRRRLR